tara:strand:- start:69 stop:272 length:204 start_codon:yes stop_codon:yes gene_type:complete
MYSIYTHNGSEITKAEAEVIVGPHFLDIMTKENEKQLNNGHDVYNSELQLDRNNSLNIRSSYKAALL